MPWGNLVRLVRLELTRLSTRASKTRMATNYITTAFKLLYNLFNIMSTAIWSGVTESNRHVQGRNLLYFPLYERQKIFHNYLN